MKFAAHAMSAMVLGCLITSAQATPPHSDPTTDAFWIFSKSGVKMYSKDGAELLKNLPSAEVCVKPAMTSKLTHGDGAPGDNFGRSVQISGDTALVGAWAADSRQGSAYVYARSSRSGTWTQQAKLKHFDGQADDRFGLYTALDGDTAVVGAPRADNGDITDSGAAYIYVRNSGAWTMQQKITADDGAANDKFGTALSVSGDTVVLGSIVKCAGGDTGCGAAYVYVRAGTSWTLQQKLTASDSHPGSYFGFEVKVDGDTVVVGANGGHPTHSPELTTGSAYVFVRSGTTWTQQQKLTADDGGEGDYFGRSVGISGDNLVVGASRNEGKGAAYFFIRSPGAEWTQVQKVTDASGGLGELFGMEVALSGDSALIGATAGNDGKGHAYVYVRDGGTWVEQKQFVAFDGAMDDQFSRDMDISGDMVLVGSPADDKPTHNGPRTGSIHVYVRTGSDWSDGTSASCGFKDAVSDGQKYVFASNTQSGSFVEVFSIASGMHVGSIPTCNFPYYLSAATYREEVWVHCWSPEDEQGDEGHVDIFSSGALGLDHRQVNLNTPLKVHAHGVVKLDVSVPNYAYATLLDVPALQKVNVHTRDVSTLWLNRSFTENCAGFYRMAISPINKHAFLRCYVCCSCGVDGDTGKECSSSAGQVTLADGSVTTGHCGHSCEGTKADNVGVLEYDLIGERPVGTHTLPGDVGGGNPYISPKGDFLVLLSNDGAAAKIIEIGESGLLSSDQAASDVELGFQSGGTANTISSVVFIEDDTYDLVMFTSTMDDYVVVADLQAVRLGAGSVPASRITLDGSSGHGRGARRMAVRAAGSRYVMINSNRDDKVHIIDLGSTGNHADVSLVRTLSDTPSTVIVYVPASPQGPQGMQGPQGQAGMQGPQGEKGVQGLQGEKGVQGLQGLQGLQGNPGINGLPGVRGERGEEGDGSSSVALLVLAIVALAIAFVSLAASALALRKIKSIANANSGNPTSTLVGKSAETTGV